jgi:hypothetical protein
MVIRADANIRLPWDFGHVQPLSRDRSGRSLTEESLACVGVHVPLFDVARERFVGWRCDPKVHLGGGGEGKGVRGERKRRTKHNNKTKEDDKHSAHVCLGVVQQATQTKEYRNKQQRAPHSPTLVTNTAHMFVLGVSHTRPNNREQLHKNKQHTVSPTLVTNTAHMFLLGFSSRPHEQAQEQRTHQLHKNKQQRTQQLHKNKQHTVSPTLVTNTAHMFVLGFSSRPRRTSSSVTLIKYLSLFSGGKAAAPRRSRRCSCWKSVHHSRDASCAMTSEGRGGRRRRGGG